MILDHYNFLVRGLFLLKLKKICNPPPNISKSVKKRYNLMENEQDISFQSERGCALDFFIGVQYDFEV
jgi:hypothetical protein